MRNERIDFYKGILMAGVVWGHLCTILLTGMDGEMTLHTLVRTYDMPFFMFLSGFFLAKSCNKYPLGQLLIDKTTTILLPSLLWSLLFSTFHSLTIYYFLLSVFFSSVVMVLLSKLFNSRTVQIALAVVVALLLHCVDSPLCNMPYLFPFFAIGFFVDKIRDCNVFILVAYMLLYCFWSVDYTVWSTGSYVVGKDYAFFLVLLLRFFIGIAGIFVAKTVMDMAYDFMKVRSPRHFMFRSILTAGKYTLAIYILQNIFVFQLLKFFIIRLLYTPYSHLFLFNIRFTAYIVAPVLCLVIMLLSIAIVEWCNKNTVLRWLWGAKLKRGS